MTDHNRHDPSPKNWSPPKCGEINKFTVGDIAHLGYMPTWTVKRALESPLWRDVTSSKVDELMPILTIEQGFAFLLFSQLLAFGLTEEQATVAMWVAEDGLMDKTAPVLKPNASAYRGVRWHRDRHLLVRNWSTCAVAHTHQLRETQNVCWYDLTSGERTVSTCHLFASTIQIPISDIYTFLTRVLPEGMPFH